MPKEVTRPDLIDRYNALGYPNRSEFEAKHGLPTNLLGVMPHGRYNSPASAGHIARLEAAIALEEAAQAENPPRWSEPLGPELQPGFPGKGRRPVTAALTSNDDISAVEQFVDRIAASQDIGQVDECNKLLTVLLIRGLVTDGTARVLKELLSERRQSLHAKQDREDKAKAGNEMVIRIVYVHDWCGGPLPGDGPA